MDTYLNLVYPIVIFAFGIKIAYNIHKNKDQLIEMFVYDILFSLLLRGQHNQFIDIFLVFFVICAKLNYEIFYTRQIINQNTN